MHSLVGTRRALALLALLQVRVPRGARRGVRVSGVSC